VGLDTPIIRLKHLRIGPGAHNYEDLEQPGSKRVTLEGGGTYRAGWGCRIGPASTFGLDRTGRHPST